MRGTQPHPLVVCSRSYGSVQAVKEPEQPHQTLHAAMFGIRICCACCWLVPPAGRWHMRGNPVAVQAQTRCMLHDDAKLNTTTHDQ
jgi:hypothetical protein